MRAARREAFDAYNLRLIYPRNPLFTYYVATSVQQLGQGPAFLRKLLGIAAGFALRRPDAEGGDTVDVDFDRRGDMPERLFNTAGFEALTIPKLVVVNQRHRLIVDIPLAFTSLSLENPKLYDPAEILALIDAKYPGLGLGARIEFEEPLEWTKQLRASKDRLTKDQVIFYYLALREIRVYFDRTRDLGEVSDEIARSEPTVERNVAHEGVAFRFAFPRSAGAYQVTVGDFLDEVNYLTGLEGAKTFALQVLEPGPGAAAFVFTPSRRGETPLDEVLERAARLEAGRREPTAALELQIVPRERVEVVKMRALGGAGPALV